MSRSNIKLDGDKENFIIIFGNVHIDNISTEKLERILNYSELTNDSTQERAKRRNFMRYLISKFSSQSGNLSVSPTKKKKTHILLLEKSIKNIFHTFL